MKSASMYIRNGVCWSHSEASKEIPPETTLLREAEKFWHFKQNSLQLLQMDS